MLRLATTSSIFRLAAAPVRTRAFHTTPVALKTVTEKVADAADTVNKKLGQGLASAIDKGEKATKATKETISSATDEAKQKARAGSEMAGKKVKEASDYAGHKADQVASGARQAKVDAKKSMDK